jgi:hypothetical protein
MIESRIENSGGNACSGPGNDTNKNGKRRQRSSLNPPQNPSQLLEVGNLGRGAQNDRDTRKGSPTVLVIRKATVDEGSLRAERQDCECAVGRRQWDRAKAECQRRATGVWIPCRGGSQ